MSNYSWIELHGALTHFPIALIIVAFLFEVGAPLFKKPEWRVVSFWCLLGGVLGGAVSLATGWLAANDLYKGASSLPAIVLQHRLRAFISMGLALIVLTWRIAAKDRLSKNAQIAAGVLLFLSTAMVASTGYLGGKMVFGGSEPNEPRHPSHAALIMAPSNTTPPSPQLVAMGERYYNQDGCIGCHSINGTGGHAGPNLSHEGSNEPSIPWQIAHMKNPTKVNPGSTMPPFDGTPDAELNAIAAYVVSHK